MQPQEAKSFLAEAWLALLGQPPSRHTQALLTAHWALETDAGQHMPGFNFAGLKAAAGAPSAVYRTVEGFGATRREVRANFRIYPSPEAGARDYLQLLKTRYPAALEAAKAGDLPSFAQALAAGGYFTADPRAYAQGLKRRLAELEPASAPRPLATVLAGCNPGLPGSSVMSVLSVLSVLSEAALAGSLHALQSHPKDA